MAGLAFAIGLSVGGYFVTQATSGRLERVIDQEVEDLLRVKRLAFLSERLGRTARTFLFAGGPSSLEELAATRREFAEVLRDLSARASGSDDSRAFAEVGRLEREHEAAVDRALGARQGGAELPDLVRFVEEDVQPLRTALNTEFGRVLSAERQDLANARQRASARAEWSSRLLLGGTTLAAMMAVWVIVLLRGTLAALSRSQAELRVAVAKLEDSNRDLDAFAGRVAHDVRNILGPVLLSAGSIRAHRNRPEAIESVAARIERAARRADALVDTLLAFSRAGAGAVTPNAVASVREAAAATLESLEGMRQVMRAEVETDMEDMTVRCPPTLLLDILLNLISNAFKALEGRPVRLVRVSAREAGGSCEIAVADTGPGIAREHQAHIFKPFYRAPSAPGQGSGIGLATVQRVVEAFGGSVVLSSEEGQGARFVVTLPRANEQAGLRAVGKNA